MKMLTTDWGSYYVPEGLVTTFQDDLEIHMMMDMPIWRVEENFDELWKEYKIVSLQMT